jgi:DNA-binding NarL/FixJ family response regulator
MFWKQKTKSNFDSNFLSPREIEVLKLICLQKSTAEIADQLLLVPEQSRDIATIYS